MLVFWLVLFSVVASIASDVLSSSPPEPSAFHGNGLFVVGVEISPGAYRSNGAAVAGGTCYYERLSASGNTISKQSIPYPMQNASVTIRESDGAFYTSGCRTWRPAPVRQRD